MEPFGPDPELVRQLASLLEETGLGEIEYADGERRIRVARPVTTVAHATIPGAVAAPVTAAVGVAPEPLAAGTIAAPMVGTAYVAPEPEAPPFVRVGDAVQEGQTLLIIEAMKVMNPITAPRGGKVTQVLVANGQPVEYDQPLVVIE